MKKLFACIAPLALLGACATGPETTTDNTVSARPEREFTTGSNIPRRTRMGGDAVNVLSAEDFERARTSGIQGPPSGAPAQ